MLHSTIISRHAYEKEPGRGSEIQVSFTGPNVYLLSTSKNKLIAQLSCESHVCDF